MYETQIIFRNLYIVHWIYVCIVCLCEEKLINIFYFWEFRYLECLLEMKMVWNWERDQNFYRAVDGPSFWARQRLAHFNLQYFCKTGHLLDLQIQRTLTFDSILDTISLLLPNVYSCARPQFLSVKSNIIWFPISSNLTHFASINREAKEKHSMRKCNQYQAYALFAIIFP